MRHMKKIAVASIVSFSISSFALYSYAQENQTSNIFSDKEGNQSYNAVNEYYSIEKSSQGLVEHKQLLNLRNEKLKKNKVSEIETTITFSKPLTYEEVQTFIKKHKIDPKQLIARSIKDSERITTAFAANSSEKDVNDTIKSLTSTSDTSFIGFIDMKGKINYDSLDALTLDSNSFMVDTSGDDYLTNAKKGVYAHSLSWFLEDLSKNETISGYQSITK
ncbi:hypothetical protein ACWGPW_21920 [Paenibacillus chitinolyticus]